MAVFDATNTTRKRRQLLYQTVVNENGFNLFFVESLCDKEDIIDNNIREVCNTGIKHLHEHTDSNVG